MDHSCHTFFSIVCFWSSGGFAPQLQQTCCSWAQRLVLLICQSGLEPFSQASLALLLDAVFSLVTIMSHGPHICFNAMHNNFQQCKICCLLERAGLQLISDVTNSFPQEEASQEQLAQLGWTRSQCNPLLGLPWVVRSAILECRDPAHGCETK